MFDFGLLDELSVASELLIDFPFAPGEDLENVAWCVAGLKSGSHLEAGLPLLKGGTRKEEDGVVRHFNGGTERAMVMKG